MSATSTDQRSRLAREMSPGGLKGVIAHEWLEPHGGAEKVVDELALLFPNAAIRSLWNDAPGRFPASKVSETWMAKTPLRRHKGLALPFMPFTWRNLGTSDADWILCSSHLFAHHARFSGPARHAEKYVYAYTPGRYIWNPELDDRGQSVAVRVASVPLRALDRSRAKEPTAIAAISEFVRKRIEHAWRRDSEVIYPPVDVNAFASGGFDLNESDQAIFDSLPDSFILGASRFIPYKRLDLVIQMGVAADVHVVLAGSGPSLPALRRQAAASKGMVTFVDSPSQELLAALYRQALAYVFPAVEDFGIMPVEAMATGAAVIASSVGGAAETVVDGSSGVLLDDYSPTSMRDALDRAIALDPQDSVARAREFDKSIFHERMSAWMPS
jgi:glycosyltransferase involved in cell wall biosynthesis